MGYLFLPYLIVCSIVGVGLAQRDYGLCSQVYLMHQYCTKHGDVGSVQSSSTVQVARGPIGKAGARGIQGPPGTVDYSVINETIKGYFTESDRRINDKLADYEKKINKTSEAIFGVGRLSSDRPTDCSEVVRENAKIRESRGGVFDIYPESENASFEVYCDLTVDGGGWTVFQRRMDGSEDFFRDWNDYVSGFGRKHKEMWLGLETIYQLTKNGGYELRVDLSDWEGGVAYAKYGQFSIADSFAHYRLSVADYTGTAGDALKTRHNGQRFSTKDSGSTTCATRYKGGWWYGGCHHANLNGIYYTGAKAPVDDEGISWHHWKNTHDYSLKTVEMKFRKKT